MNTGSMRNTTKYNWFVNAVLQIYLRIPKFRNFHSHVILSANDLKLKSDSDRLLLDIITEANKYCFQEFCNIPVISMDAFRKSLQREYADLYSLNKTGDAYKFMIFFNNFLGILEETITHWVNSKLCTETLQINYTIVNKESNRQVNFEPTLNENIIIFPAHKIIPLIEKSKLKRSLNWLVSV